MRHSKREVNSERGKERKLAEDQREARRAKSLHSCAPLRAAASCPRGQASERPYCSRFAGSRGIFH